MIGSWAGELGQTQFLPTHYLAHAEDYDGDGRRNLLTSVADVIGSTGSLHPAPGLGARAALAAGGARAGQPAVGPGRSRHPASALQVGVARRHGRATASLPADNLPASLLLPMGRFGPAFLAYPNFQVYLKWNQSLNYAITAAHLATRLAGAPAMTKPTTPIPELSPGAVQGVAAAADAARLLRRRDRRQDRRRDARRREEGADEIGPARRFLSDAGAARSPARGAVRCSLARPYGERVGAEGSHNRRSRCELCPGIPNPLRTEEWGEGHRQEKGPASFPCGPRKVGAIGEIARFVGALIENEPARSCG